MDKLLSQSLLDPQGNLVPTASLSGHVFALYFSAHWCPPCRQFTPVLSKWYTNFTEKHPEKKFVVVFVSSDRSLKDFDAYRSEMSFYALPFEERDTKTKLSAKFGIKGIPTMLILDAEGNLISSKARDIVTSDANGDGYPWAPKPFKEAVAGPLFRSFGDISATYPETVEGKYVAFYFSGHWCGPCRQFTPSLIKTYNALKEAGKPFEVVFVSADNEEDEFGEYYSSMPWLAIPYGDQRIEYLNSKFEIEGIPALVLVDPTGRVVSKNLRGAIDEDPTGSQFPWPPAPVLGLSQSIEAINEVPTVLIFTDDTDEQAIAALEALEGSGKEELAAASAAGRDQEIQFAFTKPGEKDAADRLLNFLSVNGKTAPFIVLVDVPSAKKYVVEGAFSDETVRKVVADYRAKTLAGTGLKA